MLQIGDCRFIVQSANHHKFDDEIKSLLLLCKWFYIDLRFKSKKSFLPCRRPFELSLAVLHCFPSLTVVAVLFEKNRYLDTRGELSEKTRRQLTTASTSIYIWNDVHEVTTFSMADVGLLASVRGTHAAMTQLGLLIVFAR